MNRKIPWSGAAVFDEAKCAVDQEKSDKEIYNSKRERKTALRLGPFAPRPGGEEKGGKRKEKHRI